MSSPVSTVGTPKLRATIFPAVPNPLSGLANTLGFLNDFENIVNGSASRVWSWPGIVGSLPWSEVIINKSSSRIALISFPNLTSSLDIFSL